MRRARHPSLSRFAWRLACGTDCRVKPGNDDMLREFDSMQRLALPLSRCYEISAMNTKPLRKWLIILGAERVRGGF